MGKGYQGRHKGDVAIDNAMRDARSYNYKERRGIKDKTIIDECKSENKKPIKYPKRNTDPNLTAVIAKGYDPRKDSTSVSRIRLAEKKKEAELLELSNQTGIPVDILRKNPNLKPLNWEELQAEAKAEEDKLNSVDEDSTLEDEEFKNDNNAGEETTEDNTEA